MRTEARAEATAEAEQPPVDAVKPPEAAFHDPAWLVQNAWSVFRLPRLQELIRQTIVELQALPPLELAGYEPVGSESAGADRAGCDPAAEALRACCEELRDASGMPGADADRASHCQAVRDYMAQHPSAWSDAFSEALLQYRKAATRLLESTFNRAVAA
jgi:hypothetical protein